LLLSIVLFVLFIGSVGENETPSALGWVEFIVSLAWFLIACIMFGGFFTLQPNEARVLVLFGKYKGTVRDSGFFWGNPFYTNASLGVDKNVEEPTDTASQIAANARNRKKQGGSRGKLSLRARTLNSERIKVNDRHGNPIEIAMVVVWRVHDTAQAVFDVNDYQTYVDSQSEIALRHVASIYSYDQGEDSGEAPEITLRGNVEDVSAALKAELETRLSVAGVVVDDARLTHLAYATEIAQAMLRRQQAEAVIAARKKIVEGAVGMVEMAITSLEAKHVLELDDERKAAMVSNLMVVLCGESNAQPIVNTGSLYV
jgi:regulator of protease activity HflC (stomatin/prohibitin superfamily)